jgi:ABC-type polar amino acid transport system ATPase subunit
VGLKDQDNVFAMNLSGGQKRKLSVAIALIGDPKVISYNSSPSYKDPDPQKKHLVQSVVYCNNLLKRFLT